MPWHPASHGRYFTTVSFFGSMTAIVPDAVFAERSAVSSGATGIWIGSSPTGPLGLLTRSQPASRRMVLRITGVPLSMHDGTLMSIDTHEMLFASRFAM